MDILGQFIAECCVELEQDSEGASELYAAYKDYAEKQGHNAMTATAFGLRMGERGFEKKRQSPSRRFGYLGIRLRRLGDA